MTNITKEQFNEYLDENWNQHFYKALVECVRTEFFPNNNQDDQEEYRQELKQLIWEAISHGVKEYLEEYDGEAVKIITDQFINHLAEKKISINFS